MSLFNAQKRKGFYKNIQPLITKLFVKSVSKISIKIAAIATSVFLLFNLLLPLAFQPKPVSAVSIGGFTWTAELTISPMHLLEKFWRILSKQLALRLIRIIQRMVLDFFQQISDVCPPYLRYRGTNVCRKIVGDWREFFNDAVASAQEELIGEIGRSSMPADWRAILISALSPIDDPGIEAKYLRSGGAIPNINTWENFFDGLDPQRNILGQILVVHDEALKGAAAALEAAKK